MRALIVGLFGFSLAAAGCSDSAPAGCVDNSSCDAGAVCQGGQCASLCVTQSDCPSGLICTGTGVCSEPSGGPLPDIQDVLGNDTTDPMKITDGMVVNGANLDGAVFEMQGTGVTVPLTVRTQDAASAHLVFPVDVESGVYVLVATNGAGSDQMGVTLELPELTGDIIVTRINTTATGTIASNRLPVGTGPANVAAGDHNHDADYYTQAQTYSQAEVDATFLRIADAPSGAGSGANYVPNTHFTDGMNGLDMWDVQVSGTAPSANVVPTVNGLASINALENGNADTVVEVTSDQRIVVDRRATYAVVGTFDENGSGALGAVALGVRLWDANMQEIDDMDVAGGGGDWWHFIAKDVEPANWTRYQGAIGPSTPRAFPGAAKYMSIAARLNYDPMNPMLNDGDRVFRVQGLGIYYASGFTRTANNEVTYGGNVGIGVDNPSTKLHVIGSVRAENGATGDYIQMARGGTNAYIDYTGADDLDFRRGGTTRMKMSSGGSLSVNHSADPAVALHVRGTIRSDNGADPNENITMRKTASHGFINTTGAGELRFQHDGNTRGALLNSGQVRIYDNNGAILGGAGRVKVEHRGDGVSPTCGSAPWVAASIVSINGMDRSILCFRTD